MDQYILKYKGSNAVELNDNLSTIKKEKKVSVIEGNEKLMLVKMDDKTKNTLEQKLSNWSIFQHTMLSKPPDNKKKLKKKAYK
jgi:hypothetical protein